MGKIIPYEFIYEAFNNRGYELLSKTYINAHEKLTYRDDENFYYYQHYNGFMNNRKSLRFHKSNPYTIQNIKLWCKLNNKQFELLSDKYDGNDKKLKWKCLKEDCREIFEVGWNCVFSLNVGCNFCAGRQVGLSNCLATKNPELAKEWHPTLNGSLTPWDVTCGSNKEVWWKCKKNHKHEWSAEINNRAMSNTGCPYCSHRLPSEEYNLLVINPKLCEEWDYDKNDKWPEEFCPNCRKYAHWICKKCGYSWEALIYGRNDGSGCPECSESKGEIIIREYLKINNIIYSPQKTFDGLVGLGNGLLSYDFYIPKYNLLIEYQGEYHDGTVSNQTEEQFKYQQEHDKRKKEYAKQNGYNFLEIWYWDFDRIEEILNNYISNFKEVS